MQVDFNKNFPERLPQSYFNEVWVAPLREAAFRIL